MATVAMTYAREHFAELCERVFFRHETIVITKGKRKDERVAIIPIQSLDLLEKIEQLIDLERARTALEDVRNGANTPSLEDIKQALGIEEKERSLSRVGE